MKILVACFLLYSLGMSVASPAPSWPDYSQYYKDIYDTYSKALNGGGTTVQQGTERSTKAQNVLGNAIGSYVLRRVFGGSSKQQSSDEVAALMESLINIQHQQEPEEDDDYATLQGLFNILAKVQEERAKEADSKSAKAQFLKGLFGTLLNAGKGYLVNRYCPGQESPTES